MSIEIFNNDLKTTVTGTARGQIDAVLDDIVTGAKLWRLWTMLGWNDIRQRYRRSILGPFWLTASMAVMVLALGFLYANLFRISIQEFLPFLCVGLLVWNFASSFLTEGGNLFTGAESYIKQIRLPFSVYVYRSAWSKVIIFAHNFVIYFGILIYFEIWPGLVMLFAIPAMAIVILNGAIASLYVGIISARFRDIPQLINSVVQIIFFMTPIMWKPELLQNRAYFVQANPVFHIIEIVRAPLLGSLPTLTTVLVVCAVTTVNLLICAAVFVRYRARIPYWV